MMLKDTSPRKSSICSPVNFKYNLLLKNAIPVVAAVIFTILTGQAGTDHDLQFISSFFRYFTGTSFVSQT